jgi:hypothetical protein
MKLERARWRLRSRLAEHPGIYLPIARRRYPDAVLSDATELVIDGFTRSAVTFATIAFQLAQRRPVRVAHTLHSAGHLTAAASRGVPAIVTIRDPDDVALSTVIREPYVTLALVLDAYTRFYERLTRHRGRLAIAPFDVITSDFGRVIQDVNARFGTAFDRFEQTPENVEACYAIIEDRARHPPWSEALGRFECGIIGGAAYHEEVERHRRRGDLPVQEIPERRVQRPSEERARIKLQLREALEDPRLRRNRARARAAYLGLVTPAPEG